MTVGTLSPLGVDRGQSSRKNGTEGQPVSSWIATGFTPAEDEKIKGKNVKAEKDLLLLLDRRLSLRNQ